MPDYGDLYFNGTDSISELITFCCFVFIFLWCGIGCILDKIAEYKEKKKNKTIEDFYDALAESDIRTSFTCSDAED